MHSGELPVQLTGDRQRLCWPTSARAARPVHSWTPRLRPPMPRHRRHSSSSSKHLRKHSMSQHSERGTCWKRKVEASLLGCRLERHSQPTAVYALLGTTSSVIRLLLLTSPQEFSRKCFLSKVLRRRINSLETQWKQSTAAKPQATSKSALPRLIIQIQNRSDNTSSS